MFRRGNKSNYFSLAVAEFLRNQESSKQPEIQKMIYRQILLELIYIIIPPLFPMRRIIFYVMYAEFWAKKMTMMLKVMEALLTIKTYPTTKHPQAPKFKINRKKLKTIW